MRVTHAFAEPCEDKKALLGWLLFLTTEKSAHRWLFLAYRSARQRSSMLFSVTMFCEPGVSRCARSLDRQRADSWECVRRTVLSDRTSARSFLPFQPSVQVRCAETPEFTDIYHAQIQRL